MSARNHGDIFAICQDLEPRLLLTATINAADFVPQVTNPYYPLAIGTEWVYRGQQECQPLRKVVDVLSDTKEILGVTTTIVEDQIFICDKLVEKSFEWFAQDKCGNVWFFGEDVQHFEDCVPVSTKGSWQAGVDNAQAGIIMEAHPEPCDIYWEEFAPGVAENQAKVLSDDEHVCVDFGNFCDVLKIKQFSLLEPDQETFNYYVRGIGLVKSTTLGICPCHQQVEQCFELVSISPNPQPVGPGIVGKLPFFQPTTVSTIADNGDKEPSGVIFVPAGFPRGGCLKPGDVLVSNFTASDDTEGAGSTIVKIQPDGRTSTFFEGTTGLGLTLALGILKRGFVVVGSAHSTTGSSSGSLLVIDRWGNLVSELTDETLIDGPSGLAINDHFCTAQLFVSSSASGTISRINVRVGKTQVELVKGVQIASGYGSSGPAGLAFACGSLFVASPSDNKVFIIRNAACIKPSFDKVAGTYVIPGTGKVLIDDPMHLHGPVGLVFAPNGHLIISNNDSVNDDSTQPSEIAEFTSRGKFVSQFSLDDDEGAPFGIAVTKCHNDILFAAVNDLDNTASIWNVEDLRCR